MYTQASEVSSEVSSIETRFTALLSRKLRPEILFTVGPGLPTTCKEIKQKKFMMREALNGSFIMA